MGRLGATRGVKGAMTVAFPYRPDKQAYSTTDVPVSIVDGMPQADYQRWFKGQILNGWDHRRFDTRVVIAAQDLPVGEYQFFDKKLHDGSERSLDASVTIPDKTKAITNMIEEGKIEGGYTMIVESIQVDLVQPHRDFNAFASNTGQPSTLAPSATDTTSATNTVLGLARSCYLEFSSDREMFAEGRLDDFPSERVFYGAFGGATPEGFMGIGLGQPRMLRNIVVLQEMHHFDVTLTVVRTVTSPMDVEIGIALCGVLLQVG